MEITGKVCDWCCWKDADEGDVAVGKTSLRPDKSGEASEAKRELCKSKNNVIVMSKWFWIVWNEIKEEVRHLRRNLCGWAEA